MNFPESDWQMLKFFKRSLSALFNNSEHIELDYRFSRFSRSCMFLNIISPINKGIITSKDLLSFSDGLQTAVSLCLAEIRPVATLISASTSVASASVVSVA